MTHGTPPAPLVGVIGITGQSVFLRADDLPREGETALCNDLYTESGGKGHNQAIACAKMGIPTVFVGSVGDDGWGETCQEDLTTSGVIPLLKVRKGERTAFAAIGVDAKGNNQVLCYAGAGMSLSAGDIATQAELNGCTMLLTQLEISDECVCEVLRLSQSRNIPAILNPAPARALPSELIAGFYAITPNEHEAKALFGIDAESAQSDSVTLKAKMKELGVRRAAITLGAKGVLLFDEGRIEKIPPFSVKRVVDTTGAGDAFNGALAARLAQGESFLAAARFAVVASGLSVCKAGAATSMPSRAQVDARV